MRSLEMRTFPLSKKSLIDSHSALLILFNIQIRVNWGFEGIVISLFVCVPSVFEHVQSGLEIPATPLSTPDHGECVF